MANEWKRSLLAIKEQMAAEADPKPELKVVSNIEPEPVEQAQVLVSEEQAGDENKKISDIRELIAEGSKVKQIKKPKVQENKQPITDIEGELVKLRGDLKEAQGSKKSNIEDTISLLEKRLKRRQRLLSKKVESEETRKKREDLETQKLRLESLIKQEESVDPEVPKDPDKMYIASVQKQLKGIDQQLRDLNNPPELETQIADEPVQKEEPEVKITEKEIKEKISELAKEAMGLLFTPQELNEEIALNVLADKRRMTEDLMVKFGELPEVIYSSEQREDLERAVTDYASDFLNKAFNDRNKMGKGLLKIKPEEYDENAEKLKSALEKLTGKVIENSKEQKQEEKSEERSPEILSPGIRFVQTKNGFRAEPTRREDKVEEKRDWEAERQKIMEEVAKMEKEPEKFGGIRVESKVLETLRPKVEEQKLAEEPELVDEPKVEKKPEPEPEIEIPVIFEEEAPAKIEEPIVQRAEPVQPRAVLEYPAQPEYWQTKAALEFRLDKIKNQPIDQWLEEYGQPGVFDQNSWDKLLVNNENGVNEKKRLHDLKYNQTLYALEDLKYRETIRQIHFQINNIEKGLAGFSPEQAQVKLASLRESEKSNLLEINGLEGLRKKDGAEEKALLGTAQKRIASIKPENPAEPTEEEVALMGQMIEVNNKIKEVEKELQQKRELMPQAMGVRGMGLEGDEENLKKAERIMKHYQGIKELEGKLDELKTGRSVLNEKVEKAKDDPKNAKESNFKDKAKKVAIGTGVVVGGGLGVYGYLKARLYHFAAWILPTRGLEFLMKFTGDPGGSFRKAWGEMEKADPSKLFKKEQSKKE